MLEMRLQRLEEMERRLATTGRHVMEAERARLSSAWERLEALSPTGTLRRGYSLALDARGDLVSRAGQVSPGDHLELVLQDGRVDTRAERVRPDDDRT